MFGEDIDMVFLLVTWAGSPSHAVRFVAPAGITLPSFVRGWCDTARMEQICLPLMWRDRKDACIFTSLQIEYQRRSRVSISIRERAVEGSSDKRRREIVLKILADHGWQLVEDQEQFAVEICAEICQHAIGDTKQEQAAIQRAVMRQYCVVLHAACVGPNVSRQHRAFTELWKYLFPIALYKTHDAALAQDLAQQSLEKIWKYLPQCKDPTSFLGWASMILINEVRDWFRKNKHLIADSFDVLPEIEINHPDKSPESEAQGIPRGSESGETDWVMNDDLRRQLLDVIEKCLKDPRQRVIIIESFFNERGYKEIAEMLGLTVGNVHVLRHRALRTLRKCQVFIEALGDYFK